MSVDVFMASISLFLEINKRICGFLVNQLQDMLAKFLSGDATPDEYIAMIFCVDTHARRLK